MTDEHDGRLRYGFECGDCERRWYYDRYRCPVCGSTHFDEWKLEQGTLLARTVARVTPADVRDESGIGLAAFDDDVRVVAQLDDADAPPEIGDVVELEGQFHLRDGDEAVVGPRLVPVDTATTEGGTHS